MSPGFGGTALGMQYAFWEPRQICDISFRPPNWGQFPQQKLGPLESASVTFPSTYMFTAAESSCSRSFLGHLVLCSLRAPWERAVVAGTKNWETHAYGPPAPDGVWADPGPLAICGREGTLVLLVELE